MEQGKKFDQGKPPISLIPRQAIEGCAQAFAYGAKKYGTHNYRKGISYSRLLDACMRHVVAFADGEDKDPESDLSHIYHALACLSMLSYMESLGEGYDDRHNRS